MRVGRPRPRYSNFGFELLGHAIAAAAGTTYADLVHRRIADALRMEGFYPPATPDQLRPTALAGTSRRGRPRQPWTGEAIGPAGGIRAVDDFLLFIDDGARWNSSDQRENPHLCSPKD